MNPQITDFIEMSRELKIQVESLRNIIAARAQELSKLTAQAKEDQELVWEVAQTLSNLIYTSENRDYLSFSEHQLDVMRNFLELANQPLFPPLGAVRSISDQDQAATG
jgi:hypothetical protein